MRCYSPAPKLLKSKILRVTLSRRKNHAATSRRAAILTLPPALPKNQRFFRARKRRVGKTSPHPKRTCADFFTLPFSFNTQSRACNTDAKNARSRDTTDNKKVRCYSPAPKLLKSKILRVTLSRRKNHAATSRRAAILTLPPALPKNQRFFRARKRRVGKTSPHPKK